MKKWEIIAKKKAPTTKQSIEDILALLLENRGIKSKKEAENFLHPKIEEVTIKNVGIDEKEVATSRTRIEEAIEKKEQIIVFGDYDVDGICGAAILWETLYSVGANVVPYIPHRIDEGYGLSIKGIENLQDKYKDIKLIITVDNGIVAFDAVEFANKNGIDVIITDHHVVGDKMPNAYAIVHTTKLCGTSVGYLLSQEIKKLYAKKTGEEILSDEHNHLELVALATIADLVPLTGANRIVTKFGLEMICSTKRIGLLELFKEALLKDNIIGTYQVGHIIAPRLNAMGRLEYAMESLRLLCTKNSERAKQLAEMLGRTNKERQQITFQTVEHALSGINSREEGIGKLLFISHETYQPGVIGLVAGRLVEEFYRPAIVLSIGEKYSKASARSIAGFNIIEFIRSASHLLVDAGGHPMAAGFTVETEKLILLKETLESKIGDVLSDDLLTRSLRVDTTLPFTAITQELHKGIQTLAPFGMGNPEPVFTTEEVTVVDMRIIGKDGRHLKLKVSKDQKTFDAIAFGMAERTKDIHTGDAISIAYTIDENEWQGRKKLQLKIKDIHN